jgi:excisionase family DNA binding protein
MPISTKEAAQILGVHPESVCKAIREGRLRASRLGARAFMIEREDLDAFVRKHPKPAWLNRL